DERPGHRSVHDPLKKRVQRTLAVLHSVEETLNRAHRGREVNDASNPVYVQPEIRHRRDSDDDGLFDEDDDEDDQIQGDGGDDEGKDNDHEDREIGAEEESQDSSERNTVTRQVQEWTQQKGQGQQRQQGGPSQGQ
ncbi:hypothetical protein BGW38_002710, partial [Lunasporangiospora selenospora]